MVMIQIDNSKPYSDPVVYNSYVFHSKTQQSDEPFDNYLTVITALAKLCEFESLEERMIRDKIIVGVNCSSLREKLLKLKDPKLNVIIAYCRLMEKEKTKDKGNTGNQFGKLNKKHAVESGNQDLSDEESLNTENFQDSVNEITFIDVKQEEVEEEIDCDPGLIHYEEDADKNEDHNTEGSQIKIEVISNYEQYGVGTSTEDGLASTINKNFVKLQNVFSLSNGNQDVMIDAFQESNLLENNFQEYTPEASETKIIYAKCNNCQAGFDTMEDLEIHIETCQNQIPNIFNPNNIKMMINKNFQFIKKNMDKAHPVGGEEKSFQCPICHKRFRKQQTLKSHYRWHNNWDRCKCEECGKTFAFPSELKQHARVHTDEKPYKCKECDAKFKDPRTLRSHLSVHTGERPFKCDVCGKSFTRKFYLDTHILSHSEKKPFQCQGCDKGFGDSASLKRHILVHTQEKPYKCDICNRHFREKGALRKHIHTHSVEKPYKCEFCGKTYCQKVNLKAHSIVHTGEMPFKCEICGLAMRGNAALKNHLLKHSGELPFKCNQCEKAYRDKGSLNRHLIVHMDESPYKCKVCNNTFRTGNNLKLHSYIHTGEKPYVCNDCGRAFRSKSTMKEHMYRIHKNIHISKKKRRYRLRNRKAVSYDEHDLITVVEEVIDVKEENIDCEEDEHEATETEEKTVAETEENA